MNRLASAFGVKHGARSGAIPLLALFASACASDPFEQRLEEPRTAAAGFVAAVEEPVDEAPPSILSPAVSTAAEELDRKVLPDCAEPRASEVVRAERFSASDALPPEFTWPDGAVRRARVAVTACGETRLHAVYVMPMEADAPIAWTTPGMPGGSIASIALQRDVVSQVVTQAAGIIASGQPEDACDATANEPWVLDTALAERPRKGRWSEEWTVTACGERRTITISFEETPTGANFSAPIFLAESPE